MQRLVVKKNIIKLVGILVFALIPLSQNSFAAGSIGVSHTIGPDEYSSTYVNIAVYTPEFEWGFDTSFSMSGSDSGSEDDDDSVSLGVSRYFANGHSLSFSVDKYNGRYFDIKTKRLSSSLQINQWFSYENNTSLNLSYEIADYRGNGSKKREVQRDGYTAGLNHSLTDIWSVGGSYTKYHYDINPKIIEAFFTKYKSFVGVSLARGLVSDSHSVNTGLQITEKNYLSLSSSRTNNAIDGYTDSIDLYNSYAIDEKFSIDLSVSRIEPEDGESTYYYTLSTNLSF